MEKLRLIPDKGKVGNYAHDAEGNNYGSVVTHNLRGRKCVRCNGWRARGWVEGHNDLFWCIDCVIMLDVESIRRDAPGYIGGAVVAVKATDDEIIELVNLRDKAAELRNCALDYDNKRANIITSIQRR
jgi:hypothetical protein